jgi:hypothetical protein
VLNLVLGVLFPPELGHVDYGVIIRCKIDSGEISVEHPEPVECGVVRVSEWSNGRWNHKEVK